MKDLRLVLDDTRFDELLETARSLIPTLAPEWTDHNVHDPGIMLTELIAWISEAQIYSLGRLRRDERIAYAALSGVRAQGPEPARGLVWPSNTLGADAAPARARDTIVSTDAPVTTDRPDAPAFRSTRPVLLTGARLVGLRTRLRNGTLRDWTRANGQSGTTFMPFSDPPDPEERLELQLEGPLVTTKVDAGVLLSIGIEVETPAVQDEPPAQARGGLRLRVSRSQSGDEHALALVHDTTDGLLHSGVLLLSLADIAPSSDDVSTLVIRSAGGPLLRSPRVRRVALNVLPVVQEEDVSDESAQFGTGMPDQRYRLRREGLMTRRGSSPAVWSIESSGRQPWVQVDDLASRGPGDRVYALDPAAGVLAFGNGVNGQAFPAGSPLQVDYLVSAGARGNVPADARWTIAGVAGVFGTNREPMAGGRGRETPSELRQIARRRLGTARPLVTATDLQGAALAMRDLGVARAIELPPGAFPGRHPRGLRVLVAAGTHGVDGASAEPPRWLATVAARLAPRLPLGQRLQVIGPRYVTVRVTAQLVAAPRADPVAVASAALDVLRAELAPVAGVGVDKAWPFGRDIGVLTVKGWLRRVPDVVKVADVQLTADGLPAPGTIELGVNGLPRLSVTEGDVVVSRATRGST
jgi:predicted phage baseplate assembly protein